MRIGVERANLQTSKLGQVSKRLAYIRKVNNLDFWEWMSSIIGMICGDYF